MTLIQIICLFPFGSFCYVIRVTVVIILTVFVPLSAVCLKETGTVRLALRYMQKFSTTNCDSIDQGEFSVLSF